MNDANPNRAIDLVPCFYGAGPFGAPLHLWRVWPWIFSAAIALASEADAAGPTIGQEMFAGLIDCSYAWNSRRGVATVVAALMKAPQSQCRL
ncbi:hypothetical protein LJR009_003225 [Bosea sp. LjRoot9]|uniref:hypothetical protein n=1 Tax=Bosea sp. LjRoot9 TaxID=3342341 RepID=UPI003ECFFCC7